jgi:bifunctional non-homologous end joining protein LigD
MRPKGVEARTDQLSLDLAAGFPRLPAGLRPMLPRPAAAPFDSARHLFEPAWGGRRALAFLEAAVAEDGSGGWLTSDGRPSVRLLDARGRDLLPVAPELRSLSARLEARSAVVDGELVVVDGHGRSDAHRLRERLAGSGGGAIAFLVFDLLYLDGMPQLAQPLRHRRELLERVLRRGPEVLLVPAIAGDGIALHAAVVTQRLAGVRARVATSPYLPGVRSVLWRSIRSGIATDAETEGRGAAPSRDDTAGDAAVETVPAGPILAVIRRLPLEEPDGGEPPAG